MKVRANVCIIIIIILWLNTVQRRAFHKEKCS
jgi:hypothetical protein